MSPAAASRALASRRDAAAERRAHGTPPERGVRGRGLVLYDTQNAAAAAEDPRCSTFLAATSCVPVVSVSSASTSACGPRGHVPRRPQDVVARADSHYADVVMSGGFYIAVPARTGAGIDTMRSAVRQSEHV
jgi:hypothetical protein